MFGLYDVNIFNEHIKDGNFIEIGHINRCKDFKEIKIYLGKKYSDIFVPFEDKVYIANGKKIKIQDAISFFYNVDNDKIMLSKYKCKNNKNIKDLSKVLKWSWKDVVVLSEHIRLDFLHF